MLACSVQRKDGVCYSFQPTWSVVWWLILDIVLVQCWVVPHILLMWNNCQPLPKWLVCWTQEHRWDGHANRWQCKLKPCYDIVIKHCLYTCKLPHPTIPLSAHICRFCELRQPCLGPGCHPGHEWLPDRHEAVKGMSLSCISPEGVSGVSSFITIDEKLQ